MSDFSINICDEDRLARQSFNATRCSSDVPPTLAQLYKTLPTTSSRRICLGGFGVGYLPSPQRQFSRGVTDFCWKKPELGRRRHARRIPAPVREEANRIRKYATAEAARRCNLSFVKFFNIFRDSTPRVYVRRNKPEDVY